MTISPSISPADSLEGMHLEEMTRRMAQGDDLAWKYFHETYGAMMFRILLFSARGDPHLASEALQRAYLRLARHVRACDKETVWVSWLRVLCRSAMSDARRREFSFRNLLTRKRESAAADQAYSIDKEEQYWDKLDVAMGQLRPEDRALLEAKYLQSQSVDKIADGLGISPKAVESRLTRARVELRILFEAIPHE